ncbi:transcription factor TFIIIB subunit brf1 [Borealophlyctis nickersoniae]|nr:transcription factor TFIIIB subunit brf1 [Borealophlyctis nickersoniae]
MPPARICRQCKVATKFERDDHLGHVVCVECGGVAEENTIVAEVTFSETAKGAAIADGFQVRGGEARARSRAGKFGMVRSGQAESREATIQSGYRKIADLASHAQIKMGDRFVEMAQRWFNLAVINNLTRGRKTVHLAAACLYIAARYEKTAHMLIDFADALSTNVFTLGTTFIKLVSELHLNLPLVDPALYIARFATRLEFEDRTTAVIRDANRLVQRMNRDWIQIGRRPAGICAACLFIAARMNHFHRTPREIAMVVKVCEMTLKKRLSEISDTPSGQLTIEDFQTIWLEEEQDPPAFAAAGKRKRPLGDDGEDVENVEETSPRDGDPSQEATVDSDDGTLKEMQEYLDSEDLQKAARDMNVNLNADADDGNLSDLDDDIEIVNMINVTPEEVELKNAIWMEENKDWVARQRMKEILRANGEGPKPRTKKPRNKGPQNQLPVAETPAEAARNFIETRPVLSKKLNTEFFETMLEDIDEAKVQEALAKQRSLGYSADSVTGFGRVSADEHLKANGTSSTPAPTADGEDGASATGGDGEEAGGEADAGDAEEPYNEEEDVIIMPEDIEAEEEEYYDEEEEEYDDE